MKWDFRRLGTDQRGLRTVVLGVALALLAFLVYRQVQRWRGPSMDVWVATADLAPGTLVDAKHLAAKRARARDLPANVVLDRRAIEGRQIERGKATGAPFLRDDFAPPARGPGLAGVMPEGRVLVLLELRGVPVEDLAEQLRFGDRLDVVAVGNLRGGGQGAIAVAHDAFFVGWIARRQPASAAAGGGLLSNLAAAAAPAQGSGAPSPLLLAVEPRYAVALAEAQAGNAPLSVVVHGRSEVERDELLVLPRPQLSEIELISGARRDRIPLTRINRP